MSTPLWGPKPPPPGHRHMNPYRRFRAWLSRRSESERSSARAAGGGFALLLIGGAFWLEVGADPGALGKTPGSLKSSLWGETEAATPAWQRSARSRVAWKLATQVRPHGRTDALQQSM